MITAKTIGIKVKNGEIKRNVQTEYNGTKEELKHDFLAILIDGYNDPEIRPIFNEAFKKFEKEVLHEY